MVFRKSHISTMYVKNKLHEPTLDVGTLCLSSKINMWSRWKPVHSSLETMSEAGLKSANFGIGVTTLAPDTYTPTPYTYSRPSGGRMSPFRLGDFRGYNPDARPFLYFDDKVWNQSTTSLDDLTWSPNFKYGNASHEGQGYTAGMEILPSELNGGPGLEFEKCYIGLMLYHNSTEYTVFSNIRIGEVSSSSHLFISFASNTELRNILNSAPNGTVFEFIPFISLTNNPSGQPKFNFPLGTKVSLHKTAIFIYTVRPILVTYESSYRGTLGSVPTMINAPSAIGRLTKPSSSSTSEIIETEIMFEATNPQGGDRWVYRDELQVKIGSSMATAYYLSEYGVNNNVASIKVPANSTMVLKVRARNIPFASVLYNMPNDDGGSSTIINMSIALAISGNTIPSSTNIRFRISP